jgi:cytochrome c-type biogenesis protein CcmE
MPKNIRAIIAIIVIAIFGGFGIWSLMDTATPYVGFEQARAMKKTVQVLGKIDFENTNYDENTGLLSFYIVNDTSDRMKVIYSGTKPGNFEQAQSVVCVGQYQDSSFIAKDILVKCPSKYQGPEYQEKANTKGKGA